MDKEKANIIAETIFVIGLLASVLDEAPRASIWWGIGVAAPMVHVFIYEQKYKTDAIAVFIGCGAVILGALLNMAMPEFHPDVLRMVNSFGTLLVLISYVKATCSKAWKVINW